MPSMRAEGLFMDKSKQKQPSTDEAFILFVN